MCVVDGFHAHIGISYDTHGMKKDLPPTFPAAFICFNFDFPEVSVSDVRFSFVLVAL